MGNFEDRQDEILFWQNEIARKTRRLFHRTAAGHPIGSDQKRKLREGIAELEFAIEQTREVGGIPTF